jgi:hypothetical protein
LLPFLVRLACVKRAASVDSEPGSNSRLILLSCIVSVELESNEGSNFASNQIVKDLGNRPGDLVEARTGRRPQKPF